MTLPVIGCRVAFASNPFDPNLVWTEIGTANSGKGDVRRVKTKRGRERLLRSTALFQAGTADVGLRNLSRDYDPTNTAGPNYPNVQPEKVIQVYMVWQGTEYVIWTGYADDWAQSWPGFAEGECNLIATDLFKSLAIKRMWGASGAPTPTSSLPAGGVWPGGGPISTGTPLPITYRCGSTATNDPVGSPLAVSLPVPSTVKVGDLMLAFITISGDPGHSVTTPAGWTLIRTDVSTGTNLVQEYAFRKFAVLADIGASTVFALVNSPYSDATAELAVYYNVDPINPVSAHGANVSGGAIIGHVGQGGSNNGAPGSADITWTAPMTGGEYQFMAIATSGEGAQSISPAPGWNRLVQVQGISATVPLGETLAIFGRQVTGPEAAGTHHLFPLFVAAAWTAVGGWFTGVDPTTPVAAAAVNSGGSASATVAMTCPAAVAGPLGGFDLVASAARTTAVNGAASTSGLAAATPFNMGGSGGGGLANAVQCVGFTSPAPGGTTGTFTDTANAAAAWTMAVVSITPSVPTGDTTNPKAPALTTPNGGMVVEGYAAQAPVAGTFVFGPEPGTNRGTVYRGRIGQRVAEQMQQALGNWPMLTTITPAGAWVAQTIVLMPVLAP